LSYILITCLLYSLRRRVNSVFFGTVRHLFFSNKLTGHYCYRDSPVFVKATIATLMKKEPSNTIQHVMRRLQNLSESLWVLNKIIILWLIFWWFLYYDRNFTVKQKRPCLWNCLSYCQILSSKLNYKGTFKYNIVPFNIANLMMERNWFFGLRQKMCHVLW
jgi:hypothetical protein